MDAELGVRMAGFQILHAFLLFLFYLSFFITLKHMHSDVVHIGFQMLCDSWNWKVGFCSGADPRAQKLTQPEPRLRFDAHYHLL